jgi:hypothetical protein
MQPELFTSLLFAFHPARRTQGNEDLFWTAAAIIGLGLLFIIAILLLAALIKIYLKSGKVGLLESVGLSSWLILLLFVPFGQFVLWGMISIRLARAFGRTWRFGLGIFFLPYIFLPILAWGQAEYIGIRSPSVTG